MGTRPDTILTWIPNDDGDGTGWCRSPLTIKDLSRTNTSGRHSHGNVISIGSASQKRKTFIHIAWCDDFQDMYCWRRGGCSDIHVRSKIVALLVPGIPIDTVIVDIRFLLIHHLSVKRIAAIRRLVETWMCLFIIPLLLSDYRKLKVSFLWNFGRWWWWQSWNGTGCRGWCGGDHGATIVRGSF